MASDALARRVVARLRGAWWATPFALALATTTLVRDKYGADAFAFAAVQLLLVSLAVIDIETRRVPNVLTAPCAAAALVLRAVFERSHLVETLIAGAAALAVFAVLAMVLHGGMGIGDVKLAGMLGAVLGQAVLPGLVVGILAGGLVTAFLLALRRVRWTSTIAYGPFLALGGAVAILAYHPPPLV